MNKLVTLRRLSTPKTAVHYSSEHQKKGPENSVDDNLRSTVQYSLGFFGVPLEVHFSLVLDVDC